MMVVTSMSLFYFGEFFLLGNGFGFDFLVGSGNRSISVDAAGWGSNGSIPVVMACCWVEERGAQPTQCAGVVRRRTKLTSRRAATHPSNEC